jgi:hypothetical protein
VWGDGSAVRDLRIADAVGGMLLAYEKASGRARSISAAGAAIPFASWSPPC